MILEHEGARPRIHPSAYVAPTAVICGDVRIGPDARVLFGAVLTAEGGPVEVGPTTIVMEHALIRGRAGHAARLGRHVIVGPHAHVNGAEVGDHAFLATGVAIFPGARLGPRTEVRIGGVVHVGSTLPPDGLVPIGWIAVGDPAEILPPQEHERIWAIQRPLDFPGRVLGVQRGDPEEMMEAATRRYADRFGRHRQDRVVER